MVGLVSDVTSVKGGICPCLLSNKRGRMPLSAADPTEGASPPLKGHSISPLNPESLQTFELKGVNDYIRCPSNDLLQRADRE